jgi:ATP-dependent DNA ligase
VHLLSRNLNDLSASFPELARAGKALPLETIVDGEIVIADEYGTADFGALQRRLGSGKRGASVAARERPAVLLAFDVLRLGGVDLAAEPMDARRQQLEKLLCDAHPCLQLVAQTRSVEEAEQWLSLLPNLEGVVAKRDDGRYLPGQREWVKVKRQHTADCVVIGVAGDRTLPWLVLGLRHTDGQLHHVGLARPTKAAVTTEFATMLDDAGPEEGPIRSRWQHAAVPSWRRVLPIAVCEVAFTALDSGRWFRHSATFVRWRPDRSPDDCWLDQLSPELGLFGGQDQR